MTTQTTHSPLPVHPITRSSARWKLAAAAAAAALLLSGCAPKPPVADTASTTTVTATTTAVLTTPPLSATGPMPTTTTNDLQTGSAHHNLAIDGETFRLKVDYFSTTDISAWNAFTSKDIHLLAYLSPASGSDVPQVMIDNFQAQFRLSAINPALDALDLADTQDQPVGSTPGFLITPTISYGNVFTTNGATPELLARWQSIAGRQTLNEAALGKAGVYGITITFTYRILVRGRADTAWHHRSIADHLSIGTVVPASTAPAS